MMVHAFRKGIVPRPFSESLIRNRPKTFGEIRRRVVAHIVAKGEVNEKRTRSTSTLKGARGDDKEEGSSEAGVAQGRTCHQGTTS